MLSGAAAPVLGRQEIGQQEIGQQHGWVPRLGSTADPVEEAVAGKPSARTAIGTPSPLSLLRHPARDSGLHPGGGPPGCSQPLHGKTRRRCAGQPASAERHPGRRLLTLGGKASSLHRFLTPGAVNSPAARGPPSGAGAAPCLGSAAYRLRQPTGSHPGNRTPATGTDASMA